MNINMKKKLIVTSLLAASVFASAANAADGTFNITGSIAATPCTVVNTTSAVNMGIVDKDKIDKNSMQPIELKIELANCPSAATEAFVTFLGTASGDNLALTPKGQTGFAGVDLALFEPNGTTAIKINKRSAPVSLTGGAATVIYKAKLAKKATATDIKEGDFTTTLEFDIANN